MNSQYVITSIPVKNGYVAVEPGGSIVGFRSDGDVVVADILHDGTAPGLPTLREVSFCRRDIQSGCVVFPCVRHMDSTLYPVVKFNPADRKHHDVTHFGLRVP